MGARCTETFIKRDFNLVGASATFGSLQLENSRSGKGSFAAAIRSRLSYRFKGRVNTTEEDELVLSCFSAIPMKRWIFTTVFAEEVLRVIIFTKRAGERGSNKMLWSLWNSSLVSTGGQWSQ